MRNTLKNILLAGGILALSAPAHAGFKEGVEKFINGTAHAVFAVPVEIVQNVYDTGKDKGPLRAIEGIVPGALNSVDRTFRGVGDIVTSPFDQKKTYVLEREIGENTELADIVAENPVLNYAIVGAGVGAVVSYNTGFFGTATATHRAAWGGAALGTGVGITTGATVDYLDKK